MRVPGELGIANRLDARADKLGRALSVFNVPAGDKCNRLTPSMEQTAQRLSHAASAGDSDRGTRNVG